MVVLIDVVDSSYCFSRTCLVSLNDVFVYCIDVNQTIQARVTKERERKSETADQAKNMFFLFVCGSQERTEGTKEGRNPG